jgi:hypothetical protein
MKVMTRRRITFLGIALAFVAAVAIVSVIPSWRYPILGALRGEPFYKGMPASYWRARFSRLEAYQAEKERKWEVAGTPRQSYRSRIGDTIEDELSPVIGRSPEPELPKLHDPEAVPVLIVLLLDDDPVIQFRVGLALSVIGEPAIPAILKLLENRNPKIRMRAILALNGFSGLGESAIPAVREATRDVDKGVALEAIVLLADIDAGFRDAAVSAVIEFLKEKDHRLREDAVNVLGNLCFGGLSQRANDAVVCAIGEATSDTDKGVAERARVIQEAIAAPVR